MLFPTRNLFTYPSDTLTDLPMFLSIWAAAFAIKDIKS
jgi:hypothetical protein